MLVLAFSIAWLSFLVSFSMYAGLLVLVLVVRLFQCFILVFSFFSLSISSSHFSLVLCLIIFFRASFSVSGAISLVGTVPLFSLFFPSICCRLLCCLLLGSFLFFPQPF